jgi:hypothetical protein
MQVGRVAPTHRSSFACQNIQLVNKNWTTNKTKSKCGGPIHLYTANYLPSSIQKLIHYFLM